MPLAKLKCDPYGAQIDIWDPYWAPYRSPYGSHFNLAKGIGSYIGCPADGSHVGYVGKLYPVQAILLVSHRCLSYIVHL